MFRQHATDVYELDRAPTVSALRNLHNGQRFSWPGARTRVLIGAGHDADLYVEDAHVSRAHCELERRADGEVVVRDRGSRNGTFVNGGRIERAILRPGAVLRVGNVALLCEGARSETTLLPSVVGRDPAFRTVLQQALRVAPTECSVLIVGETGTGKDVLARFLHANSQRAQQPMIAVNCGGIPRELIASELFGHERGAFTGANNDRDGYFVDAHGGTLFLDELAELPLEQQPHLLRALETRRVRRVGGRTERLVDVRLISATNQVRDLGHADGRLRLDLFHRLATVVLTMPPLRDRPADIVPLVKGMLDELAGDAGTREVAPTTLAALAEYAWPGNIRELRHAVHRAVALGGRVLELKDFLPDLPRGPTARFGGLPAAAAHSALPAAGPAGSRVGVAGPAGPPRLSRHDQVVREAMAEALRVFPTVRAAARHLGMAKSTFADRAKQWGLLDEARAQRAFELRVQALRLQTPEPAEDGVEPPSEDGVDANTPFEALALGA